MCHLRNRPLLARGLPLRGLPLHCLAVATLACLLTCLGGCGSAEGPDAKSPTGEGTKPGDAGPASPAGEQVPPGEQGLLTGDDVLRKMIEVYQNAPSYADTGTVRLVIDRPEGQIDETAKFSLTLARPNRLRLEVYQTMVVCDGRQLHAAIEDLPGQVLAKEAPETLTLRDIYADRVLMSAIGGGFAGASPQLMLMLGDDPLAAMTDGAEMTVLGEPGSIAGREHYRVQITRPDGMVVFWIDRQTYVLRKIKFPTGGLLRMLAADGPVLSISLEADLTNARLGGSVDPQAFQFEVPPGAELVKFFVPPHPAQLLGKKVPDFKFVDLDGNPLGPAALAGKIAVLDFWATWCAPCRTSLPNLEKVRRQYAADGRVALLAVSVDQPDVDNQVLRDTFTELGVQVPIARDLEQHTNLVFHTTSIPAIFILGADGIVQDFEFGGNPELATALPQKIERLLAGENIYAEPLAAYQKDLEEYEKSLNTPPDETVPGEDAPAGEKIPLPLTEIAPRSEPTTFRLAPLWKCTELQAPGNVLVVDAPDGRSRVLVVDNWRTVAEVGTDGRVIAEHRPALDQREAISNLRTAVAADGNRYFAATSFALMRFHLFDQDWNLLGSHPTDALENPHAGIGDVILGDLSGDGVVKAYVGYRGVVGVKAVSLRGEPLWSNRSVVDVAQLAIGGPDAQGCRKLVCTSSSGVLAVLDAGGLREADVAVPPYRFMHRIVAAELAGDGQPRWCGIAVQGPGENVAVGLNLQGEALWNYPLPQGVHRQPIELIVPGQVLGSGPGQWLLPGPDGSIHILAADGQLQDRFNYGATLQGLATARFGNQPVLIVAASRTVGEQTEQALEAWAIQ
ncbi:MAG: TlpA family protein disulfide reductase [Pirellulales bacterium]|nr:TlpA family protein disulfide reductase [Pirellulales bacterium]